ncbi:MAG TPA: hypothetical protein VEI07_24730 [Planctomycetaceae bacterium]|nr:hypothetical protein [Planctomycetaceae bacterium]
MQIKNGNPPNAPAICGNCGDPARLHVYDIESRNSVKVTHLCEKCAKDYLIEAGGWTASSDVIK